jgi:penicillin-binding protein 1A
MAPYFVEWVRRQLDDQFGSKLYRDGLRVFTTLDVDMQSAAERALERQLKAVESSKYARYRHMTYEKYIAQTATNENGEAANSPYLQGAFIAMDPRNGAIRAMIGGRDFDDSKFNRATQALRQPGSTFKPIVYAAAVRNGRPPSYIVQDEPIMVPEMGGEDWTPQNYDGRFEGPMPMRRALYMSRNLATVALGMELGEGTVIDMARGFGLTTPIPPYPSIHLGAAVVYPLELVAAYSAFATLGVRAQPNAILRVENARGDVLWEPTPTRTEVLSREEAWLMMDMMRDVVRRGTAYSAVWGAGFRVPAAGKTGTTNDGTDVWYIGYTPDLVAGVWMGLDRPAKIQTNAQGGILAAPAWTAFMTEVYQKKPAPPDWPRPEGLLVREVDRSTGLLQNPFCPRELVSTEFFIPGTEPVRECDVHSPYTMFQTDSTGAPIPGAPAPNTPGMEGRVTPGAVPMPQPARPGDTSRIRPRDTTRIQDPFKLPR